MFDWILIKLEDKGCMHKILDKFDLSAVCTIGMIVVHPRLTYRLGKYCAGDSDFIPMGKWCLYASEFIFYRILIKVACNQDRHKSSRRFDFGPLVSLVQLSLLRCLRHHIFPINKGHLEKNQIKDVFVLNMHRMKPMAKASVMVVGVSNYNHPFS